MNFQAVSVGQKLSTDNFDLSCADDTQEHPWWELYGGYQLTRTDVGAVQDLANSLTVPNHLPQVNVGRNLNMNGGNFSVQENPASWWGGIIEFSGSYVSKRINLSQVAQAAGLVPAGATAIATFRPTLYTIAGGPQFTYREAGKIQPFARIMLGGAHSDLGPDGLTKSALDVFAPTFHTTSTSLALLPGIGVDYVWKKYLAFRVSGDYIRTYLFNEHQSNFRLSAGVDFRIGSR